MKISHFRLSFVSITQLTCVIVLLPINLFLFSSGFSAMMYQLNMSEALDNYNAQQIPAAISALKKVKDGREDAPLPRLLEASIALERNEFEKAKKLYEEILSFSGEIPSAQLGLQVCLLYELRSQPASSETLTKYDAIVQNTENIRSSAPELIDASIFLAQVHIQKNKTYQVLQEIEKADYAISQAYNILNTAEKEITTEQTPSKTSCFSLYLGLGIVYQWKAQRLLEDNSHPDRNSSDASLVYDYMEKSLRNFRRAFSYRVVHESLVDTMQKMYGAFLSYEWLSLEQRKKLTSQAENFSKFELKSYQDHLHKVGNRSVAEKWGLLSDSTPKYLFYGLGVSYYYLDETTKALNNFKKIERGKSSFSSYEFAQASSTQTQIKQALENFKSSDDKQHRHGQGELRKMLGYYSTAIKNYGDDWLEKPLTLDQFVHLNNYFALYYYHPSIQPDDKIKLLYELGKKAKRQDYIWREVPKVLNARRIALHNYLYLMEKAMEEEKDPEQKKERKKKLGPFLRYNLHK